MSEDRASARASCHSIAFTRLARRVTRPAVLWPGTFDTNNCLSECAELGEAFKWGERTCGGQHQDFSHYLTSDIINDKPTAWQSP